MPIPKSAFSQQSGTTEASPRLDVSTVRMHCRSKAEASSNIRGMNTGTSRMKMQSPYFESGFRVSRSHCPGDSHVRQAKSAHFPGWTTVFSY